MFKENWNEIIPEVPRWSSLNSTELGLEFVEVCGLDSRDQCFIEKTNLRVTDDGCLEFLLTTSVLLDSVLLLRRVTVDWDREVSSSLFQVCCVERTGGHLKIRIRPFDPLPQWPLRNSSS